jgi:glutamate/tyrosine decarboxylase-like PLP-dependent enzyme
VLAFAKEASERRGGEAKGASVGDDVGKAASPRSGASSSSDRRRQSLRFDFSVPGVTSISIDVHKFGLSHKGTSVLLFKGSQRIDGATLRRSAFVAASDWPGGLYVSPGVAGSRSGALLAAAWASMVFVGRVSVFLFLFF